MFLPRIGVAGGGLSEEMALYSHLRFVTAASLIAFGGIIGVGVPALLFSAVERPLVVRAETSDSTASACKHQSWLHFDRNCLARRDLLSTAGRGAPNGGTVAAVSEPDKAAERPLTESRHTTTVPQESVPQESVSQESVSQESVPQEPVRQESAPQGSVLQESAPTEPTPRKSKPPQFVLQGLSSQQFEPQAAASDESTVQAPARATPAPRPAAEQRRAAKPVNAAQGRLSVSKKAARANRIAKRPTSEALNVVQKFGDSPRDIPVSAYAGNRTRAGNGSRLPLDIRPTSMQDVYYYSASR